MKTVKMRTTMAWPGGVVLAGQVTEVEDSMAEALVSGGFAEYSREKAAKVEKAPIPKRRGGVKAAEPKEV